MSGAPIQRIGFVGVGNMGWPMAANLVRAGFGVMAVDATPGRAAAFAAEVGGSAAGAEDAAAEADAMLTMLPTSGHVADVIGQAGALLRPGTLVIEMSSGVPSITQALAADLAARGVGLIDCPVSGGVARARTGELAIMAGGDPGELRRAEPVLAALGTSVHHCGGVGAGQAMKALNNLVSAGGFLIGIEALLIGQRFGLDPALMVDVLNSSSGMNNSTQRKFKQFVLSRRFDSRLRPRPDGEGPRDRARGGRRRPRRRSPSCAESCGPAPLTCSARGRITPRRRACPRGWPEPSSPPAASRADRAPAYWQTAGETNVSAAWRLATGTAK